MDMILVHILYSLGGFILGFEARAILKLYQETRSLPHTWYGLKLFHRHVFHLTSH